MTAPPRPMNQLAIVALVSAIASWVIAPIIGSLVAVVCGHMARQQIRQSGEDGDQLAVLSLVLGYSHLAVTCLACGAIVVIYGGMALVFLGLGATGQLHGQ